MVAGWSATDLGAELDALAAPQLEEELILAVASTDTRLPLWRLNALVEGAS